MLKRRARSGRRLAHRYGFTLFETTVVLLLTGLVAGIIGAIGVRLQRQLHEALAHVAVDEELSTAAAIVPLDLRAISPTAGDIRAGEARDSSLELRITVASGALCAASAHTLQFAPYLLAGGRRATAAIQPGDTVWVLTDADTGESWRPAAVRSVRSVSGSCARVGDAASRTVFDADHQLALDLRDSLTDMNGALARVTRPVRYDVYRAGDGFWYLGLRTWNSAAGAFNGVQPLAGPYAAPLAGRGTHIEYFDSSGTQLTPGTLDTRRIARVEWLVRAIPQAGSPITSDSARIVVAVRNRR